MQKQLHLKICDGNIAMNILIKVQFKSSQEAHFQIIT